MALFVASGVLAIMITARNSIADAKLLLRGNGVALSDALKRFIEIKAARLFRHESTIVRLRIDVEREARSRTPKYIAKGKIELAGPDLTASVTTGAASASITLLITKLDRMLRKRTNNLMRRRTMGDIRSYATLASV